VSTMRQRTTPLRVFVVLRSVKLGCFLMLVQHLSGQDQKGPMYASRRMNDGKQWMVQNLDVRISPSYCYEDAEMNCRR
jgi:hypothetical protein